MLAFQARDGGSIPPTRSSPYQGKVSLIGIKEIKFALIGVFLYNYNIIKYKQYEKRTIKSYEVVC